MADFKIQIKGTDKKFSCSEDVAILDAAEAEDFDMDSSCRSGICTTCKHKVANGKLVQNEADALSEQDIEDGYVLLCVAYPQTDITLEEC